MLTIFKAIFRPYPEGDGTEVMCHDHKHGQIKIKYISDF
jgi:hypothetical protein